MPLYKFSFKFILTVLLLIYSFVTFGQTNAQSLLIRWKKLKEIKGFNSDTGSVNLLNNISEAFVYNNADTALIFAKNALQLAENQDNYGGQASSLYNIAKACYVLGDYTSSLNTAEKLLNLSNKNKYQPGIAGAFQITGLIYLAQDKFKDAIDDFTKALEKFNKLKDTIRAGRTYFDLGICYDDSGHPEKAFYFLDKAYLLATAIRNDDLISMVLNRSGEANFHLKKYDEALAYYQRVKNSKFTSTWELGFALSGIAQTYYALGVYDKAITNARESYLVAKKVNSEWDAVRALEILAKSFAAIKDYQQAYNYQVQFKKSGDSLYNNEKAKQINDLRLKQQQVENSRLKSDLKANRQSITYNRRLSLLKDFIGVVVIVFLALIVRSNLQKTALNKVLRQQNEAIALQKEEISSQKESLDKLNRTKNQLFSVISHDLRSPFSAILQTMDLIREGGDISGKEQEMVLENFHRQISLVAMMVNNLLIWANSQQSGIKSDIIVCNVSEVIDEIINLSSFLAANKQITIGHIYSESKLAYADPDHLRIIIQNLVSNAIKFTKNGGEISIFYAENDTWLMVHVKDNGMGISPGKMEKLFEITGRDISGYGTNNEAGAGIGLVLIKQFVDANEGRLEVKSRPGEGSEFIVYLKRVIV